MYMAFSRRNRPGRVAGLLLGLACIAAAAAQQESLQQQPISLDAADFEVDYRTNTVIVRDVVISQGDVTVRARRAEATDLSFEDSRWSFEGDVRIDAEKRGSLRSDRAVVDFRNNRITQATITGSPAQFEQQRTGTDLLARGRAGEIVYLVGEGTVRLSHDAWVTDGRNEISGPQLVYDIRQERVQATAQPGEDERVRITIVPQSGDSRKSDRQ